MKRKSVTLEEELVPRKSKQRKRKELEELEYGEYVYSGKGSEVANKSALEICKGRKEIRGTIKQGCIVDDYVVLWSQNKETEKEILSEYNMIKELEKYGLPVVNLYGIYPINVKGRSTMALVEETLSGNLYKPHDRPIEFTPEVKTQIKSILDVLQVNKILIEDFQWMYTPEGLKIIDPFKIYKLDPVTKSYIILGGEQDKRKQSYRKLEVAFNDQNKNLQNLLDYVTVPMSVY
jgi:hypothetical protein